MPLYEYQCECGKGKDMLLSFKEFDQPQKCECGRVLQKKVSSYSFTFKQYGGQMALDTLNSKDGGFPAANKHKSLVQEKAFEGTQKAPRKYY